MQKKIAAHLSASAWSYLAIRPYPASSFIDLLPILGMGGEHQGLTAMPRLEDYGM
jgi:hypothetical protein